MTAKAKLNVVLIKADKLIHTLLTTNQEILAQSRRNDWRVTELDLAIVAGQLAMIRKYALTYQQDYHQSPEALANGAMLFQEMEMSVNGFHTPYHDFPLHAAMVELMMDLLVALNPEMAAKLPPAAEPSTLLDSEPLIPVDTTALRNRFTRGIHPADETITVELTDENSITVDLAEEGKLKWYQLQVIYQHKSPDHAHPLFPLSEYTQAVLANETREDYWVWVVDQIHKALNKPTA